MTAGGREFQVAGTAQLKDRLLTSVRLNGAHRETEQPITAVTECRRVLGCVPVLIFLQRVNIACYAEGCTSYSKSVRPSVRLSVRHTLALCQYDSCYDHGVFTGG